MTDPLRAAYDQTRDRNAQARAVYDALRTTGKVSSHRLLTYRCPRRCLLLDVVNTPDGLILHRPRYKLSPRLNAESSNESGRTKNTEDGDRRWTANTGFVESWGNVPLTCDHLRVTLDLAELQHDLDARHAEITVRADGERGERGPR